MPFVGVIVVIMTVTIISQSITSVPPINIETTPFLFLLPFFTISLSGITILTLIIISISAIKKLFNSLNYKKMSTQKDYLKLILLLFLYFSTIIIFGLIVDNTIINNSKQICYKTLNINLSVNYKYDLYNQSIYINCSNILKEKKN